MSTVSLTESTPANQQPQVPEPDRRTDSVADLRSEDQFWRGWRAVDVNCKSGGLVRTACNAVMITGYGSSLLLGTSSFRFVYRSDQTPEALTAFVKEISPADVEAKAGLMARWGPPSRMSFASIYISPDGAVAFASKYASKNAVLDRRHFTEHAVSGLRLIRRQSTLEGLYFSVMENAWISISQCQISKNTLRELQIGLMVCSASAERTISARFEQIVVSIPDASPPAS